MGWEVAGIQAGATNSGVSLAPHPKEADPRGIRISPTPTHVSLLDRWCLSNCRREGASQWARELGCVPYLGNEACCPLGGSPPPPPQSKQRNLETREEMGPMADAPKGLQGEGLRSQTATHPPTSHPQDGGETPGASRPGFLKD